MVARKKEGSPIAEEEKKVSMHDIGDDEEFIKAVEKSDPETLMGEDEEVRESYDIFKHSGELKKKAREVLTKYFEDLEKTEKTGVQPDFSILEKEIDELANENPEKFRELWRAFEKEKEEMRVVEEKEQEVEDYEAKIKRGDDNEPNRTEPGIPARITKLRKVEELREVDGKRGFLKKIWSKFLGEKTKSEKAEAEVRENLGILPADITSTLEKYEKHEKDKAAAEDRKGVVHNKIVLEILNQAGVCKKFFLDQQVKIWDKISDLLHNPEVSKRNYGQAQALVERLQKTRGESFATGEAAVRLQYEAGDKIDQLTKNQDVKKGSEFIKQVEEITGKSEKGRGIILEAMEEKLRKEETNEEPTITPLKHFQLRLAIDKLRGFEISKIKGDFEKTIEEFLSKIPKKEDPGPVVNSAEWEKIKKMNPKRFSEYKNKLMHEKIGEEFIKKLNASINKARPNDKVAMIELVKILELIIKNKPEIGVDKSFVIECVIDDLKQKISEKEKTEAGEQKKNETRKKRFTADAKEAGEKNLEKAKRESGSVPKEKEKNSEPEKITIKTKNETENHLLDIAVVGQWLLDKTKNGSFFERIPLKKDGSLDLVDVGPDLQSPALLSHTATVPLTEKGIRDFAKDIQENYQNFRFSFARDPKGTWLEYKVEEVGFEIGDMVLWEIDGVLQWVQPKKIIKINEKNKQKFVEIEGVTTSIPLHQLIKK